MPHTGVILILVIGVTLVCSQTSTNPDGAPFFSPSLVRELPLDNSTISSIILLSPWDYADFYWGYIPENVGLISITFNFTSECDGLSVFVNFVGPDGDSRVSFPCLAGNDFFCVGIDTDLNPEGLITYEFNAGTNNNDFRPGKAFYATVYQELYLKSQEKRGTTNCSYTIQASKEFNCGQGTAVGFNGNTLNCLNYSNVTSNGQMFTGITGSQDTDVQVYRLDVPKNVTWLYALVTAPVTDLSVMIAEGFAPVLWSTSDAFANYYCDTLSSNSSLYVYSVELELPLGDSPVYFSVKARSGVAIPYNISIFWEYCGPFESGLGYAYLDCENLNIGWYDLPCSDPVTFTNFQFSAGNYTFNNVPAFNSTYDFNEGAYAFVEVHFGSYGAVNITCTSTENSFFVYCKGQSCDCSQYTSNVDCNYAETLMLISQDLYPGGYWTFGVCNESYQPANITLTVSGSVIAPPSPSPVPSATPGGSSTGQDTSGIEIMTPAVILIVLAASVQL